MNKKHKMLIPKIDTIHPNLRNSTLKDYYLIMKTKYKFILKKWLEILKRNAQKESINTNNNIQQKSDMKIGVLGKKGCDEKPVFRYLPSSEELEKMIVATAEKTRNN